MNNLKTSLVAVLATVAASACSEVGIEDVNSEAVVIEPETIFGVNTAYTVLEPSPSNHNTVTYEGTAQSFDLQLLKVANAQGLSMSFIVGTGADQACAEGQWCSAPFGARLFKASYGGKELLYTDVDSKLTNWGPYTLTDAGQLDGQDGRPRETTGWIGIGGAEAAFPTEEHGFYSATRWDYRYQHNLDGSVTFESKTSGNPGLNETARMAICGNPTSCRLDVTVSYTLAADGPYWRNKISIHNPNDVDVHNVQYWHNYMLPAGNEKDADPSNDKHLIEVLIPALSDVGGKIQVHSSGDSDLNTTGNEFGALSEHTFSRGSKVTKIHGSSADGGVQQWLGLFVAPAGNGVTHSADDAEGRVMHYGFYDHNASRKIGLGIVAAGTASTGTIDTNNKIFPKAFGGPGFGTDMWTNSGKRYVEMWFSPLIRSFWNSTTIGRFSTRSNETIVFPILEPGDLQAMDPFVPSSYAPGLPVAPEPEPETPSTDRALGAWTTWAERNTVNLTRSENGNQDVAFSGSGDNGFNGGLMQKVCGVAEGITVAAGVTGANAEWTEALVVRHGNEMPRKAGDAGHYEDFAADGTDVIAATAGGTLVTPSAGQDCIQIFLKAGTFPTPNGDASFHVELR